FDVADVGRGKEIAAAAHGDDQGVVTVAAVQDVTVLQGGLGCVEGVVARTAGKGSASILTGSQGEDFRGIDLQLGFSVFNAQTFYFDQTEEFFCFIYAVGTVFKGEPLARFYFVQEQLLV